MSRQTYRQSLFLDDRLRTVGNQQHIVSMAQAQAQSVILPATWIFHVGHCGSTYLSRMLEQLCGLLALREPVPLRALAVFKRDLNDPLSLMAPDDFQPWLQLLAGLLVRRYDAHLATVVKATSDCAPLAQALLSTHLEHRALRVSLSLEQYLKTMLRSDLRRQELMHFAQSRLADLHAINVATDVRLYELSVGELAAMCWLSVTQVLRAIDGDNTMDVDFDQFLVQPEAGLTAVAQFLSLNADPDAIASVAGGEVAKGYSKDPSMRYNRDIRAQELAASASANAAQIDAGLRWAQQFS
ncbi:MAG: hypothetical protein AB8B96_07265 [Lysobacterales bacterium]